MHIFISGTFWAEVFQSVFQFGMRTVLVPSSSSSRPQIVPVASSPRPRPVLVPEVWNLSRPRPVPSWGRARTRTVPGRLVPSYGPLLEISKWTRLPSVSHLIDLTISEQYSNVTFVKNVKFLVLFYDFMTISCICENTIFIIFLNAVEIFPDGKYLGSGCVRKSKTSTDIQFF